MVVAAAGLGGENICACWALTRLGGAGGGGQEAGVGGGGADMRGCVGAMWEVRVCVWVRISVGKVSEEVL